MNFSIKLSTFLCLISSVNIFVKSFEIEFYNLTNGINEQSNNCITSDKLHGICMPITYCFHQYDNMNLLVRNKCVRNGSLHGVCCPIYGFERELLLKTIPITRPVTKQTVIIKQKFDDKLLDQAINAAVKDVDNLLHFEKDLVKNGIFQKNNTMESFHQGVFGAYDSDRREIAKNGKYILETSRHICKLSKLRSEECSESLKKYCLSDSSLKDKCVKIPGCDQDYKYRTIDGSCNNLEYPLWGRAMTSLSRLMPPEYSDGIDQFRKSVFGTDLPNVRYISTYLSTVGDSKHPELSVMFMQFAQFIDHDMTLGLNTRMDSGEGISCCNTNKNGELTPHPACKPIIIPGDDPFYIKYNRTCNNFVRNIASPTQCNLGPREQANSVTIFIDGSHIYGSDMNKMNSVRSFVDGKLKASIVNGKEFLPYDTTNASVVCAAPTGKLCTFAGDFRSNQQFGLVVLQLIFLREHNRICETLKSLNPTWTDEIIFQETRRIIGAILAWITFNEFLPIAIGRTTMKIFELCPSPWLYNFNYDPKYNPSGMNEFVAAAFRWHSLITSFYQLIDSKGQNTKYFKLKDIFNDPTALYEKEAVNQVFLGIANQPAQIFDPQFSADVAQHLFPSPGSQFGGDLVSINLQRGRDHGLPPYTKFRKLCGLPEIKSFDDLNKWFRYGSANLFRKVYNNVDDIDLFIGGIHELPLNEGILGPVFACIVAEQFRRIKLGDRFWFENYGFKHSFSEAQIHEIRKVSLSGIICNNADDIKIYPPLALLQPMKGNPWTDCNKIPQMNLINWRKNFDYPTKG